MSGEALYERYKDALKRGHVASLRGRLDEALDAYAEASRDRARASDAPRERRHRASCAASGPPTPCATTRPRCAWHRGTRRRCSAGRRRSPRSTAGPRRPTRSTRWPSSGRPTASWRTPSMPPAAAWSSPRAASDAGRSSGSSSGSARRSPGSPAGVALERALSVLEGPRCRAAPAVRGRGRDRRSRGVRRWPRRARARAVRAGTREPEAPVRRPGPRAATCRPGTDRSTSSTRPSPRRPALDAQATRGPPTRARGLERLLDLAAATAADGQMAAATSTPATWRCRCDPDHVGLHLALVELYDEQRLGRRWPAEKLDLLDRLVVLDDDRRRRGRSPPRGPPRPDRAARRRRRARGRLGRDPGATLGRGCSRSSSRSSGRSR